MLWRSFFAPQENKTSVWIADVPRRLFRRKSAERLEITGKFLLAIFM